MGKTTKNPKPLYAHVAIVVRQQRADSPVFPEEPPALPPTPPAPTDSLKAAGRCS